MLKWRVHRAVVRAKLEPFLGFLHSEQFGEPSLVWDLMEPYRCLVDDLLVEFLGGVKKKDFQLRIADYSSSRKGKREFLDQGKSKGLLRGLYGFFEGRVDVARIRHGRQQTIETLINEEALLFAKYLRSERETWIPRIAGLG